MDDTGVHLCKRRCEGCEDGEISGGKYLEVEMASNELPRVAVERYTVGFLIIH